VTGAAAGRALRVSSWNVNGLRSIMRKGFVRWVNRTRPDVVALQETRIQPEDAAPLFQRLKGFHPVLTHAQRPGYSGVGTLAAWPHDELVTTLGSRRFDVEGRAHFVRYGRLWVVNTYVPNGNGKDRDNSRIPYKLAFWQRLFDLLEPLKQQGERILVMGDFNTSPEDLDLARPKQNHKTSGFTPIEREAVRDWLRKGWVDTFRHYEKGGGHYSWWSQRYGVREKNIGWRLDMVFASPGAMPFLQSAFIEPKVKGSDHCPVGVTLDDRVLGASSRRLAG
jgi:exodeoxyribonuclease III